MHLGNMSLILSDTRPLSLAPVYDMLPMQFRPGASGEIVPRALTFDLPLPDQRDDWQFAAAISRNFWQRVADDAGLSASMRKIAGDALQKLAAAAARA
jgi:serine/threonine protein kinase HipA of HipAB toxin-antitoxin module